VFVGFFEFVEFVEFIGFIELTRIKAKGKRLKVKAQGLRNRV